VLIDWVVVSAPAPLAAAIAQLEPDLKLAWTPLPMSMAAPGLAPAELHVQAGVFEQFHTRSREGQDVAALALMAISDVLSGVQPYLRRWAQQRLADATSHLDAQGLHLAGTDAQAMARQRLADSLPKLVSLLASGRGWR
jgi:hypothetical protein